MVLGIIQRVGGGLYRVGFYRFHDGRLWDLGYSTGLWSDVRWETLEALACASPDRRASPPQGD